MESPMEQVENIKCTLWCAASLFCVVQKDSKCLWYSFVPKNQRWNRSEPLAKKKTKLPKAKVWWGNPGITMPTEPHIKQRKSQSQIDIFHHQDSFAVSYEAYSKKGCIYSKKSKAIWWYTACLYCVLCFLISHLTEDWISRLFHLLIWDVCV